MQGKVPLFSSAPRYFFLGMADDVPIFSNTVIPLVSRGEFSSITKNNVYCLFIVEKPEKSVISLFWRAQFSEANVEKGVQQIS